MSASRNTVLQVTVGGESHTLIVRRKNALEVAIARASVGAKTAADVCAELAHHVKSTTISLDGDPYPDDEAARVEWWAWFTGPLKPVADAAFLSIWGLDVPEVDAGN